MDIIIEVAATTAFIIGFFFGPSIVAEVIRGVRG